MTLEYRCSRCGALLETTAADPRIEAAPKMLTVLKYVAKMHGKPEYDPVYVTAMIAEVEGKETRDSVYDDTRNVTGGFK